VPQGIRPLFIKHQLVRVIFEGEPLLDGKFLPKGQTRDPIAGIPSGMRLKTISVDAQKSVAGLLSPGDRVDLQLLVERNERENIIHPFTKIFLQNIRVYAVDQTVQRSADGTESRTVAKTVSLIVTPQQANRITLGETLGEISLIPRHPDDEKIVDDGEQSIEDLLARSDSSSRKTEQGQSSSEPDSSTAAALASALQDALTQAATVEMTPPFRMKVIFPGEVQELQFDAETGEPVNVENQDDFGVSDAVGSGKKEASPAVSDGDVDSDAPDNEFPIGLDEK